MNPFSLFFAVFGGICNTVQAGANSQLRKSLDQPFIATAVVYGTGLLGITLVGLFAQMSKPDAGKMAATPWWAWLGGALSIVSTLAGVLFAKKMGSAVFTSLSLTAALVTSVFLDHFGWVGFEKHAASPWRLVGCGLLVGGILLISKF